MSSSIISDSHTLCLRARDLTPNQLTDIVKKWMSYDPTCSYILVIGTNHQNQYMGFGYLRVEHKSMFYMLLGKKPDGSENVLYVPDPTFVPKSTMDWTLNPLESNLPIDWEQELNDALAPMITVYQPPYIEIPSEVLVSPAMVKESEQSSMLIVKGVTPWITEEMLKDITKPFSTHKNFPTIEMKRSINEARIHFYSSSFDANFAALLLHKKTVHHPVTLVSANLSFRTYQKNYHPTT